jgi:hypothetical protein
VDLDIVPLELRLSVVVYLRLLFWEKKVFDQNIWSFKLFPYHAKLYQYTMQKGKPTIVKHMETSFSMYESKPDVRKRSVIDGCSVYQVPGRDSTDPAFMLSTGLASSLGEISLTYAVGSSPGATDICTWSKMTKPGLLAPLQLLYGIPLYWSVKGTTSDGQSVTTQCALQTYDNTHPDGRIDVWYPYTSHPHKIGGTIVVFDDSSLRVTHVYAIGLTQGYNGNQVIDWSRFNFTTASKQSDLNESFGSGKTGKLTAMPLKSLKKIGYKECAQNCIDFGTKCISFDYEFHSETCDLHAVIEGPQADLRVSGSYKHYERVDLGNTYLLEHSLDLLHGVRYYINAEVTNVLMFRSLLSSEGTIVDFTPPEPYFIGNATRDQLTADGCRASKLQRCVDVTWRNNHRLLTVLFESYIFLVSVFLWAFFIPFPCLLLYSL